MPDLTTKSFRQILADQATAAQASAGRALDFSVGSLLRAISEAVGSVALWLQAEILKVLASTRLATSSGADADSFVEDYGLTRTPATFAATEVTMSRFTTGVAAAVPIGAGLRTGDGQVSFVVTTDTANPAYDPTLPGYRLAAGAASITVPVAATVAGTAGNVDAGTISLLTSPIGGIDTVVNGSAATGGADAETDADLRGRFPLYLASLAQATKAAVSYAVSQVRPGLTFEILEGAEAAAFGRDFVVVVSDGGTTPSSALINAVGAAIEPVRALGVTWAVVAGTTTVASVSLAISTAPGANHASVVATVAAAIQAYINGMEMGETLAYSRLAQIAYAASPSVTNVTSILLNGGTADLDPPAGGVIRAGTVSVS